MAEDVARISRRPGGVLTLVVLDLDQLKSINDRHGHLAGDTCLKHFVGSIQSNIREGGWLARWGEDEFVLAFHEAEKESSVRAKLERVGEDLRKNPVRSPL